MTHRRPAARIGSPRTCLHRLKRRAHSAARRALTGEGLAGRATECSSIAVRGLGELSHLSVLHASESSKSHRLSWSVGERRSRRSVARKNLPCASLYGKQGAERGPADLAPSGKLVEPEDRCPLRGGSSQTNAAAMCLVHAGHADPSLANDWSGMAGSGCVERAMYTQGGAANATETWA